MAQGGFDQYGNKTYKFGFTNPDAIRIGQAIGMRPTSLSVALDPEFTAEAQNEVGVAESYAQGPDKASFTLSGYIVNSTLFGRSKSFTYDGRFYIIQGRKSDTKNTEFEQGEMTGMSWTNIRS